MKKYMLLFFAISLLTADCFSQIIDELPKGEDGTINFNEVVHVEGTTASELYLRSKQFFVDTFKSANDVIQMDDKEAAFIIGKGYSDVIVKSIGIGIPSQMWYTVRIQSKESRYKYEIYDIYFKAYPDKYNNYSSASTSSSDMFDKKAYLKPNGGVRNIPGQYKDQMIRKISGLTGEIKTAMSKQANKKDDW